MPYILIEPQHAEELNRALYRLMRPSHLRDDSYVTDQYCAILSHPTSGLVALDMPDMRTVPIHPEADGAELSAVMDTVRRAGDITQKEADDIDVAIVNAKSRSVRMVDFIPPTIAADAKTREQMDADGWFPKDDQSTRDDRDSGTSQLAGSS